MSSSTESVRAVGASLAADRAWAPALDLTTRGQSAFDPARIQEAVDEGYAAGFDAGQAAATTAARAEIDALIARVGTEASALLASLGAAGDRLARTEAQTAAAYAAAVSHAAVGIAEAIVGRALSEPTVAAMAAVERVLATVDRRHDVRVQLHPEDIALLEAAELPDHVTLEANPGLRRGDAVAQTDDRTVDARVSTALDRARLVLEEHA